MSREPRPDPRREPGFVNCFLAGAQKCGTTALAGFLAAHPDFCLARGKESHFFDTLYPERTAPPDLGPLAACFDHWTGQAIRCDATPIYMFLPRVPGLLRRYNPEARIILILRDPVERAYSNYRMAVAAGHETLPFGLALRREASRLAFGTEDRDRDTCLRWMSYTARGLYADQIENLLRHFDRTRLLILRTEELLHEHAATLRRAYAFLGIAGIDPPAPAIVQAGGGEAMDAADRDYLRAFFAPEIFRLEDLLGWDLSAWRHIPAATSSR